MKLLLFNRVVGNQIHVALEPSHPIGQFCGVLGGIVQTTQKDVFEADATAGHGQIVTTVLQQGLVGIGMSRGDELFPQRLVGGMEAHRQGELGPTEGRQSQLGQLRKGFRHANGAHRDPTLTNPEVVIQAANGIENCLAVEERFPHAHEHDVRGPAIHHLPHAEHLINDLVGAQRALQAAFTGGAETAGHRTAHLAGHTDRQPLISGDANGLDRLAVIGGQQQFGRRVCGNRTMHLLQATDLNTVFLERLPPSLRQNGDLRQGSGSLGVEPVVQLPPTKGLLPLSNRPALQLGRAATEQHLAHQIRRPWPSLISTASRAMKPSMAARPLSFSV